MVADSLQARCLLSEWALMGDKLLVLAMEIKRVSTLIEGDKIVILPPMNRYLNLMCKDSK